MNPSVHPFTRTLGALAIAAACLLTLPSESQAKDKKNDKDKKDDKHGRGHGKSVHEDHDDHGHDHQVYIARPRSTFTLSLGNGYAGRGYYYGPANSGYYYERPEVRYYATREQAPREYYSDSGYRSNSTESAVQSALARRGYYQGSIDGSLGPMSRRAIARYQQDQGLRVTGSITSSLLSSLRLQ